MKDFANERVDLCLLANHGLVELVEQVFGKTGFDFEFGEPLGRWAALSSWLGIGRLRQ